MSDDVEWGTWVDHDGKGCPVVGLFCHVIGLGARGEHHEFKAIAREHPCWDWTNFGKSGVDHGLCGLWAKVTRYRIRKPRALLDLITIAADPYARPPVIHPEGPVRAPQPEGVPA